MNVVHSDLRLTTPFGEQVLQPVAPCRTDFARFLMFLN